MVHSLEKRHSKLIKTGNNSVVKVFSFWQEIYQVHFLLEEVKSSLLRLDWLIRNHYFPTHTLTHMHHCLLHPFFFSLAVSKNTFKPISGINFTYSKLIIL